MRNDDFKYKICGLDRVVEEHGSTFIAVRKIAWGVADDEEVDEKDIKVDIRKYYSTAAGEKMNKGISISESGTHELTKILLEEGYGDTEECIRALKDRSDFKEAANAAYDTTAEDSDDYLDPRELFLN